MCEYQWLLSLVLLFVTAGWPIAALGIFFAGVLYVNGIKGDVVFVSPGSKR